jgi:nicotinate-nucleotide--dimethylbenzimidazole phosphoribosyltransferase
MANASIDKPTFIITESLGPTIARIRTPLPETAARAHLDSLTKPLGALGRLEDVAAQLATLSITECRKAVYVFAADHGLAQEGVSAYPPEVTRQMVLNFLGGGAAINVLARQHHAALTIVDCGVAGELPLHRDLIARPVRKGSRNALYEAAMSHEELGAALQVGLDCAAEAPDFTVIAVGEMGIGNTSAAALLTAAITGAELEQVTGRGTGLDDLGRARKLATLRAVLALHQPHLDSPQEILRRLGGLEIAAMAGFMIGCAANGSLVVVDGYISTAAAAAALALCPQLYPYLLAAHRSPEPGHTILLAHLGLVPLLDLGMRLGEGTGAVLAMPLVESALALYREMATFASAQVSGART